MTTHREGQAQAGDCRSRESDDRPPDREGPTQGEYSNRPPRCRSPRFHGRIAGLSAEIAAKQNAITQRRAEVGKLRETDLAHRLEMEQARHREVEQALLREVDQQAHRLELEKARHREEEPAHRLELEQARPREMEQAKSQSWWFCLNPDIFSLAGCAAGNPHTYLAFLFLCVVLCAVFWQYFANFGVQGNALRDGCKLLAVFVGQQAQARLTGRQQTFIAVVMLAVFRAACSFFFRLITKNADTENIQDFHSIHGLVISVTNVPEMEFVLQELLCE